MKSKACLIYGSLTALLLSGCATTSSDSNLSYRKSLPSGFKSYGVSSVSQSDGYPTRTGDSSIRFEVRDGDCSRSEGWDDCRNDRQRHEYIASGVAGDVWYNWSLYIPPDFPSLYPATVTMGQFHQRSNPPFMFQVSNINQGQHGGYNIDRQSSSSTVENAVLLTDEETRGQWSDILIHANWHSDYRGFFRIYVNGETTPRYEYSGRTMDAGDGNVDFKFGIYQAHISRYKRPKGSDAKTPTQIVYYDDVFKSTSCEKAAVYFDCDEIMKYEDSIQTSSAPTAPPKYERSEMGLYWRYVCWKDAAEKQGETMLPSSAQIRKLGRDNEGLNSYLSHFKIRKSLGSEITNAHKEELLHLVNFVGTKDEYCATLK